MLSFNELRAPDVNRAWTSVLPTEDNISTEESAYRSNGLANKQHIDKEATD